MSERIFGHIEGIIEGQSFKNRLDLSFSKIHRPTQAGISGGQNEGADSIVISGGYEDDEDYGDFIIYTGHGGRKDGSIKQVVNQELVRGNLALAQNVKNGFPVRVIRGKDKKSDYAPEEGYRYDGLFRIEDYWKEIGISGFNVWRFRLRKISTSLIKESQILQEDPPEYKKANRKELVIQRIIRDTHLSKKVKELYSYKCQVCNNAIKTSSGLYAEAAHVKP